MDVAESFEIVDADTSAQVLVHLDTIHETESENSLNCPERGSSEVKLIIPTTLYSYEDRLRVKFIADCEIHDLQISETTSII